MSQVQVYRGDHFIGSHDATHDSTSRTISRDISHQSDVWHIEKKLQQSLENHLAQT